jgi:hypothetical protein
MSLIAHKTLVFGTSRLSGMVGPEVHRRRQSLVWAVLDFRFTHASNGATFT